MSRGAPEERPGRLHLSKVYDLVADFRWKEEEEEKERELSPNQRFVIVTLFKFMGGKDHCYPKQETLSNLTGLCIRQIKAVLKELDRIGVIERNRRLAGRVYEYRFTKAFIQSTKGIIHAPSQGAICAPLKVQPMHPKGATCAPSRCNLVHVKVPEKQDSHGRAGVEYINNRSMNRSSSIPGREEDAIIDEQISRKMQERSTGPGLRNVVTPPPDPSNDLLAKVYGIVPPAKDLLIEESRKIDLWQYLRPFKCQSEMKKLFPKEMILAIDRLAPKALEDKCQEFVDKICSNHFSTLGEIRGGYKVVALRACRGGFLNRCGFKEFCERGAPEEYRRFHRWENVIEEEYK